MSGRVSPYDRNITKSKEKLELEKLQLSDIKEMIKQENYSSLKPQESLIYLPNETKV